MSKLDLRSFQQEIAQRLATAKAATKAPPRLAFNVAGKGYCVALKDVSEVVPVETIRTIPGSNAYFLGVMNVRGAIFAVTHLAQLLGLGNPDIRPEARVLLLGGPYSRLRCGFLVENVVGLREMLADAQSAEGDIVAQPADTLTDVNGAQWSTLDIVRAVKSQEFNFVQAPYEEPARFGGL